MIIVFGSINLDLIFPLPALPSPGETVLSPAVHIQPGGKGANQAVAAARDGAHVLMAGAVGRDALAAGALTLLREGGVDLTRVVETDAPTGCAGIFVDREGRNVIGVGSGANLAVQADQVGDHELTGETTLLLQMEVQAAETAQLIHRARRHRTRVVLNLAPAAPLAEDALRNVDVLVLNETEAESLARELKADPVAASLHGVLGCTVVRTLGADGVEAAQSGDTIRIPGHQITAVDTTGAGDCFTGVLGAALDRGLGLEQALRRANAAAALCCTRPGSQATMPTAAETDQAIAALPTRSM